MCILFLMERGSCALYSVIWWLQGTPHSPWCSQSWLDRQHWETSRYSRRSVWPGQQMAGAWTWQDELTQHLALAPPLCLWMLPNLSGEVFCTQSTETKCNSSGNVTIATPTYDILQATWVALSVIHLTHKISTSGSRWSLGGWILSIWTYLCQEPQCLRPMGMTRPKDRCGHCVQKVLTTASSSRMTEPKTGPL